MTPVTYDSGIQDFIAVSKYARFDPAEGRRETFPEAVTRVANMHLRRFTDIGGKEIPKHEMGILVDELEISGPAREALHDTLFGRSLRSAIKKAFENVSEKRVLPSMRSMQFGGKAVEANESRIFNCSYSPANRPRFFQEYFFLLLSGTGCGFSVQKHHVAQLPSVKERGPEIGKTVEHFVIEDTIEGWADSLGKLMSSFFNGYHVEFSFEKIRPMGSDLKTSGGKAPGHIPLRNALRHVERICEGAQGRQLKSIEVYDILMFVAKAVLSGGVRRSATICLFSPDDEEMRNAKTGNWFQDNPQRACSNNSAVVHRQRDGKELFDSLFEAQKEFGEPGFYFSNHPEGEYGTNPCCEIGLNPVAKRGEAPETDRALTKVGKEKDYGWQMCNLSTINAAACETRTDFFKACVWAAVIGTLQASYTNIPYLGPITKALNDREALLGVSICGILDKPDVILNPGTLKQGARLCKLVNQVVAKLISIRPSARITCVKPEGTASLVLGAGSGIHPHHAPKYFRRVQANRQDPVYRLFREKNPHMCETSVYNPATDDVVTFAEKCPEGGLTKSEISAPQLLEYVRLVQKYWVMEGRAYDHISPDLHHNVSNTINVCEHEWEEVSDFIWNNREYFTGVAMLQEFGDKAYQQAPREAVTTEEDRVKWESLTYNPVDYRELKEGEDNTKLKDSAACAGGQCDLTGI